MVLLAIVHTNPLHFINARGSTKVQVTGVRLIFKKHKQSPVGATCTVLGSMLRSAVVSHSTHNYMSVKFLFSLLELQVSKNI